MSFLFSVFQLQLQSTKKRKREKTSKFVRRHSTPQRIHRSVSPLIAAVRLQHPAGFSAPPFVKSHSPPTHCSHPQSHQRVISEQQALDDAFKTLCVCVRDNKTRSQEPRDAQRLEIEPWHEVGYGLPGRAGSKQYLTWQFSRLFHPLSGHREPITADQKETTPQIPAIRCLLAVLGFPTAPPSKSRLVRVLRTASGPYRSFFRRANCQIHQPPGKPQRKLMPSPGEGLRCFSR